MSGYRVTSGIVAVVNDLEPVWRGLEARADCSYFQSWGWIGIWLERFASDLRPLLVRVWHGDVLVGLGIFLSRRLRRRGLVRSRALYLHEYPFDGRDMTIEYNGLLADRAHVPGVYAAVIEHLFQSGLQWDELFFSAVDEAVDGAIRAAEPVYRSNGGSYRRLEESVSRAIDLGRTGEGVDGFVSGLGKNRRAQVRRALRLYQEAGALRLDEADGIGQAEDFLTGLKALHTRRWQAKGRGGVFANPLWERFHRAVIRSGFPAGEIQLLRVSCGDRVIGYLYNLVWRRHVYVLQTGFETVSDARLMPGYVVHTLAVAHNRDAGMLYYDLMHGDSLYKRLLCNHSSMLRRVVVQRRRRRFVLEDLAVRAVRYCRSQYGHGRNPRVKAGCRRDDD